jgi:subtilisin family serine protease
MRRTYTILQNYQGEIISDGVTKKSSIKSASDIQKLELKVKSLDFSDAEEIRRDKGKIRAPTMPISLIKSTYTDMTPEAIIDTWGLKAVGATESMYTGEGSTIAVLDTGINSDHSAFAHLGDDAIEQKDFTGTGNGDQHGHGTHVAATIFGGTVSGLQLGVAPNIKKAYIAKVLDGGGRGSTRALYEGLWWAIKEGVDVISMSLGFNFQEQVETFRKDGTISHEQATSQALVDFAENLRTFDALVAITERRGAWEEGSILVAAAGNESTSDTKISASLPSSTEGVISVGAIARPSAANTTGYSVPAFSNIGPDVVAPGVGIVSALKDGGLYLADGTSQACPHAAGVAALWWEAIRKSQNPIDIRAEIVRERLLASCKTDKISASVDLAARGRGLVIAP